MQTFLQSLLDLVIPLFAISSMASVGAGNELREVTLPLRRPAMLVTALLANFVAVPIWSVLLIRAFDVPEPYAIGLFLMGCAAGAPFLVALTRMAKADAALAGGLLLVLLPISIVYMPLVIPWALPEANVNALAIARPLVTTMLLPLALGVLFRLKFRRLVPKVMPVLRKVSQYALLVLIAATVLTNAESIVSLLGTPAIPIAALLLLGAVLIGYVGSVRGIERRVILALGTGQRNVAAAMIVATSSFTTTEPLVMVVVTSIVGFAILFPAARIFRRQLEKRDDASEIGFADRRRRA